MPPRLIPGPDPASDRDTERAMSLENIEIVRHWFERLAAGDPAPQFCDPGIEIRNWADMPTPGPYHGHEGLHEWWTDVNGADVLEWCPAVRARRCPRGRRRAGGHDSAGEGQGAILVHRKRRPGRGHRQGSDAAHGQQRRDREPDRSTVDDPRRHGCVDSSVPQARGGPRSRRAVGVAARSVLSDGLEQLGQSKAGY